MWPWSSSPDCFGDLQESWGWLPGSADPAEGDVCASAQCSAGSFTRPAKRASWTRLSPSISCWDGWVETSSTSSVPSWLISCPCRYWGWAGSQTPQLQGGGRGWELLYPALGARDPNCPGCSFFTSPRNAPLSHPGVAPFSPPGVVLSLPRMLSLSPRGLFPSLPGILLSFPLGLFPSPPQDTLLSQGCSLYPPQGCSLLHLRTLPSPPGTPGEQGASLWDHPSPRARPCGCAQRVPSRRCTRPFTTCWQTWGCSPCTATTG